MQVNLLRFSNATPTMCSNTVLYRVYDFNRHTLASLGIDVHMLEHQDKKIVGGSKVKRDLTLELPSNTTDILLRMIPKNKGNKRFGNSYIQTQIHH